MLVGRVSDDVVFAPVTLVAGGDFAGWSCDSDFFQAGAHGYEPVDEGGVDTVLVGVDGEVVLRGRRIAGRIPIVGVHSGSGRMDCWSVRNRSIGRVFNVAWVRVLATVLNHSSRWSCTS